jgi:hypothetical protein
VQTTNKHSKTSRSQGMSPASNAHRWRCKNLPPMQPGEADRLVADFLAAKSITACPTRYAAPVEQQPRFSRYGF